MPHLQQEVVPPREAFDLMARMLDFNPSTRITAEDALQHDWFKMEPRPGPNAFRAPVSHCCCCCCAPV